MEIGNKLRSRRTELGLSRIELAEQIHVTASSIANYENGISYPKPDTLIALILALKIDANYLYQDYLTNNKISEYFGHELSPDEQEALFKYRRLSESGKQNVRQTIDEEYIKQTKAILISGTALAESPSREAAIKAVMLAKKNNTKVIFDIDYREYNWKNSDEISIYYSIVAKEADIIMGSREEFDLTEKLIQPGMSDEESAALWQGYNAKIVVIKHGMKGSTAYTIDGQKFSIKPFPVEARKGFGGGDGYGSGFLYGLYQGWEIIDCLEFGSAEASMMVKSNNCSDSLPGPDEVHAFIKDEKEKFGDNEETKYMTSIGDNYYENDAATAFEKYYANNLSFIGILPKAEGDFTLDELDIEGLLESEPEYDEVNCKMPKLNFETTAELSDILSRIGLENVFSDDADFSGIADKAVHVSSVLQKTKLELDENGTKAAAVTAVTMECMSAMDTDPIIKDVELTRPFAFLIYDSANEEVLFMGKVLTVQ